MLPVFYAISIPLGTGCIVPALRTHSVHLLNMFVWFVPTLCIGWIFYHALHPLLTAVGYFHVLTVHCLHRLVMFPHFIPTACYDGICSDYVYRLNILPRFAPTECIRQTFPHTSRPLTECISSHPLTTSAEYFPAFCTHWLHGLNLFPRFFPTDCIGWTFFRALHPLTAFVVHLSALRTHWLHGLNIFQCFASTALWFTCNDLTTVSQLFI